MRVDRKETLRYLGYRGQELDSQTSQLMEEIATELQVLRSSWADFSLRAVIWQ